MIEICRLGELLRAKRMRQAHLAKAASISESEVSLLVNRKRRAKSMTRNRICKALGIKEWAVWVPRQV